MISQNEAMVFVVLGMSLMFFGGLTILKAREWYNHIKFEYEYMKHPRLVEHSILRACQDPHEWQEAQLVLRGLPVGRYRVCMKCGTIQGREDVMCSDQVLLQMKQALELVEQKKAIQDEIDARVASYTQAFITQYVQRNFPKEVNDVHFGEKLVGLGLWGIKCHRDAQEKVAFEIEQRTELDSKYASWPSKIKGNA